MPEDDLFQKAVNYIPQMSKAEYRKRLEEALRARKKNYSPDNPLFSIAGEYEVTLPATEETISKVESIQNKILKWLESAYPDTAFVMKPTDRKGVYILGEDGELRRKKLSRLLKDAPKDVKNLMTLFPKSNVSDKARIVISTDPLDLLRKSSSRSWSHESCERIGGSYDMGPFSDIANNNAIAYVYFGDNKEPAARVMLRWCVNDEGEKDIGVEPIMYPHGQPYEGLVYEALSDILKEHGLGDYDMCITPYIYKGYSDQMGRGNTYIEYRRPGIEYLYEYATDPDISRNVALALLNYGDTSTRAALAENESICDIPDVVKKILDHEDDEDVLINLFETCGPKLTCEQAERLSKHEYSQIREYVAKDRNLPESCACNILERLSHDVNKAVRLVLARRGDLPESCSCDIFDRLIQDEYWGVRAEVARNSNISKSCVCDIFESLSRDGDWRVRTEVARNPHIPESCACDIFERLSRDEYWRIREPIASNRAIPESCACSILGSLSRDTDDVVREKVARNSRIPESCACDIFESLSRDGDWRVRTEVARNINIPEPCACDIFDRLSQDESLDARTGVARNINIPESCACDIFDKLKDDDEIKVRREVARNTHIPESCACDIFDKLKDDKEDSVRIEVASNRNIPESCACDIFESLSHDKNVSVLNSVANNPSIPDECRDEIWGRLEQDERVMIIAREYL